MEGLRTRGCWGLVGLSLFLAGPGAAQTLFTEVTEEIGVSLFNARSVAFGDYDNDGWPDIFLAESGSDDPNMTRTLLLHSEGAGRFRDHSAAILADIPQKPKGGGAVWGDYDNDGDLDLYVPVGEYRMEDAELNFLLRNDRGKFVDVTLEAGLTDRLPTDNAIWLDYDRDGFLDLYTGNLRIGGAEDPAVRNKLYRNKGDGTFADVTEEAGLNLPLHPQWGGSLGGLAAADFNDDGWPDLYISVFGAPNRLFLNNGQGGFRDATTGEIADPGEAWGAAVGDIDNDGDLDIFQAVSSVNATFRSLFLLNLGGGQFLDVTEGLGFADLIGQKTVAPKFVDIDNDGDLDLLTAEFHFLYLNEGDGLFVDKTSQSGMEDARTNSTLADWDLDGFVDVWFGGGSSTDYTVPSRWYHNNGNDNHWLHVELVGIKSNRNGVGARLMATVGALQQRRDIYGGWGFDQDEMVAHFGLGGRTKVDRLEVRWPSGQVDVLTDIPADQKIRVFEGRTAYQVIHPATWETSDSLVTGISAVFKAMVRPALFESGAVITKVVADLRELGGPEAVPLQAENNGTYTLEPLSLAIEGPNSLRPLSIMIDQQTSLGPYWTRLSRQITVVPAEDLVVFDEALAQDWQVEGNNRIKRLDLSEAGVVQRGNLAGVFEGEAAFTPWTVTFKPPTPISPVGYTALHFAFHPGEVVPPATARFTVTLLPGRALALLDSAWVDLNQRDWQVVEIPVEAFENSGPVTAITVSGNFAGTFYLDDLRLVAATPPAVTVVEEERTAALPQSFALSQNFPNPFNSDTAIRFALPERGEVELAVFNLAGQQVAKLVQGTREAGTYTVRWDGRDDQGKELASGVYVYRLRVGAQGETRKLVLVR